MQLSDACDVAALIAFVVGIFCLAGLGGGLLALSVALFVVGMSLDGIEVHPQNAVTAISSWIRSKVKRGHE